MAAISRDFVTKNGIIIEGDSAVTSSTNQTDALQAAGGVAIAKNLIVGTTATVTGPTTLNSSLTVNGQTNFNGPIIPGSGISLGSLSNPFKDLFLAGDSLYVGNVILSSTGTTATLRASVGSVKLIVGSSQITDNINATSTTTGSLVVAGGAGVAKNLYVGGSLNVTNSSTLQGPAVLSSTLSVQGLSTFDNTTPATSAGAGSVKVAGGVHIVDNAVVMSTSANTGTLESNALYVEGGVGIKNGLTVSGTAVFKNDVYFQGATTYVYSTNTVYTDNLIDLHIPLTGVDGTWIADDGKDIGFRFNYYNSGADKNALLLLSNNSKKLEFFSDSTEVGGVITNAVYGEFKTGAIQIANTTSNNGTTNTGALTVVGGVGIGKDLRVGGTLTATNISISGAVNALGLVYQDSLGRLTSQPNIFYNTSTQILVGTITRANNLTGGTVGSIPIQVNNGITTFIAPGNRGQVLIWDNVANTPTWGAVLDSSAGSANTATNIAGGTAGNIVYQSNAGVTSFLANGSNGSILTFNTSTLSPQWDSPDTLTVGFATTATFATTADLALIANTATLALLANTANSASLANTATLALLANTATLALLANTATTALFANTATLSLLANTATTALFANTATRSLLADTATFSLLANTATFALLADTATTALFANTATYALLAETSTYALLANTATYALLAETSTYALLANTATYALLAETSTRALLADTATFSLLADTATYAISADFATSATYAFTATYAAIGGQSNVAVNLGAGEVGQIPYQVSSSTTAFFGPGDVGQILVSAGTTSTGPVFTNTSSIQVGYSANVIGGSTGSIVYQVSPDTTGMLDIASTAGSLLVSNGVTPHYVSQVQAIDSGTGSATTSAGQTLIVTSGGLGVNGDSYFAGNLGIGNALYIGGDLYVDGTQFTVDSQTIATGDKTITLSTGSGTPLQAAGSGIQVGDTSTPYASLLFNGYSHWETNGSSDVGLKITSSEETYSYNSGALQVSGGVGVSGGIFVSGDVTATTFFGNLTGVATTASYALLSTTASYALLAETATHALLADTATYAINADFATSSTYAFTATYAAIGGASAFANIAITATNIANGSTGSIVIQSSPGNTSFVEIGTSTYILTSNGLAPEWTSLSNLSAGNIAFADNLKNGEAGQIVYQASSSTTRFAGPGNVGDILVSSGTGGPSYVSTADIYIGHAVLADVATIALVANTATLALLADTATLALLANTATLALNAVTATYATNVLGGNTGSLVYQSATDTTALLAGGSVNSILTYINNAPAWSTTATLSSGVESSGTVTGQSLKVTSGGIGVTGDSYFTNNVGFGGSVSIANTSYVNGSKILIAKDLETVTSTATYITNDPTLVPVSGTSTAYGTYNFGSVSDIWTFNDYNTGTNTGFYSINDASGAPGYIVYAGFSNITDFNRVVLNINYTQNSGHTVTVDLYNHQTLSWDSLTSYSGSVGWYQLALAIIDATPYISSGAVTLRIYHVSSGTPSHRTWIDYIALENSVQGGQGPRGATGATGAQGIQGLTTTTTSTFFFSNTTESSSTNTGAVVLAGGMGIAKNLNVGGALNSRGTFNTYGPAVFGDTVTFTGTATYVLTTNTVYTDSLIELHKANPAPWTVNDNTDIGILGHYYDDVAATAKDFFLGFAVDERYLEFLVNGYETTPGHFDGEFGDLKLNKILLTSTETSTSSVTGALVVPGGVGVSGNVNLQSSGKLTVGIELQPFVLPDTPINTVGNVNSYLQINNQNINSGTYASSDFILTADDGSDTNYYVDLGIANSGFSYPDFNISAPHDGYLYVQGGNLNIATGSPNKTIEFWVGGTATTSTGLTLPGTTVGKHVLSVIETAVKVLQTTAATSTASGALQVAGGVGIGGSLYVASTSYINGSQVITTATIGQYSSQFSILAGTDTVVTVTTSTGAITIWNNSTLESVTGRGATTNNAISITSTVSSVSTSSGALTVTGGVGIGNNLYVGGNIYAGGVVTATTFVGSLTGTATLALNANTATLALNANTATLALNANTATLALTANTATLALNANTATFARTATSSTNIIGGAAGAVPYQSATGTTTFLSIGTNGYILTSNGTAPTWSAISGLSAGNATTATNLAGGLGGSMPYQTSAGATTMLGIATTSGYVLASTGSVPQWASLSSLGAGSATTATNIAGGTAGQLVYQVSSGTTGFAGPGTTGTVLVSNGTGAPTYQNTLALAGTTAATNTTTGALQVAGGVGVGGSVYVGNRVGFVNAGNASVVYQFYNAATNSLDTVFG